MGKVDRVSIQPTEVFLHTPIFIKVYKKDTLIDSVKMAGNFVIEGTTHYHKRKRKQLRKRSIILGNLYFWVTLQPTDLPTT